MIIQLKAELASQIYLELKANINAILKPENCPSSFWQNIHPITYIMQSLERSSGNKFVPLSLVHANEILDALSTRCDQPWWIELRGLANVSKPMLEPEAQAEKLPWICP